MTRPCYKKCVLGRTVPDVQFVPRLATQRLCFYTFPDTINVSLNTESTYDWIRHQWTVPINLQVARIFKFGTQPVQLGVGGKYYAVSPAGGPEWGARLNVVFLFPTKG
jgi:hypothetical protein